jgi:hypothetical protein
MRWLALKREDGSKDPYAVGFVTHTVAKIVTDGKVMFEAWRLGKDTGDGTRLGDSEKPDGAKLLVEQDARNQ